MAQGAVKVAMNGDTSPLTPAELFELQECEKIVRFRNAVLSGQHPRISIPPHLVGKLDSASAKDAPIPDAHTARPNPPIHAADATSNSRGTNPKDTVGILDSTSSITQRPQGRAGPVMPVVKAAKSEINPVLLEKSDDLKKAEAQLQRQRLERVLREQVEQRRIAQKVALQSAEALPDFDISDVLSKALTIVHPSTALEAEHSVGSQPSASDSFDENSFYSSQHDTPDLSISSQGHQDTGEALLDNPWNYQTLAPSIGNSPAQTGPRSVPKSVISLAAAVGAGNSVPKTSDQVVQEPNISKTGAESAASVAQTLAYEKPADPSQKGISSSSSSNTGIVIAALNNASATVEPLIRNFDMVPVAPQPSRVSPLATARDPPNIEQSQLAIARELVPDAVVTIRTEPSSPDGSSGKAQKPTEKRKGKRKKSTGRKSGGTAVAVSDSPHVKAEPLSPSPFVSAPLPRPPKRQRQSLHNPHGLNYDESMYDEPALGDSMRIGTPPTGRRTGPFAPRSDPRRQASGRQRMDEDSDGAYGSRRREPFQITRLESPRTLRSPDPYARPRPADDSHAREAQHIILDGYSNNSPRHGRESQVQPRYIMHGAGRERSRSPGRSPIHPFATMPPPQTSARVIVDGSGRRIYAPASTYSRQSVAPLPRHGDEEYIYERPHTRAVPRAVPDVFEEDGVLYARASPQYLPQRRVVTLPERDANVGSYRVRDYSREYHPRQIVMVPAGDEYFRRREPEMSQVDPYERVPREYVSRAPTVQPESITQETPRERVTRATSNHPEAMKYQASGQYAIRAPSVHPEPIIYDLSHEHAGKPQNVRSGPPQRGYAIGPDVRHDTQLQGLREQSIRPEHRREMQSVRDYSMRPEVRGEIPPQMRDVREFSVRREEPEIRYVTRPGGVGAPRDYSNRPDGQIIRREYSVRPPDYVPQSEVYARTIGRRVASDVGYAERPRDAQYGVYEEEPKRGAVYR